MKHGLTDRKKFHKSELPKTSGRCGYVADPHELVGIDSRPAGLTYLAINVTLEANRWVRVVLAAQNIPPGIQNRLNIWPLDNSGPTVAFTGLEMVALPSGPISTTATIGHILRTGAVGSNGFAKY